MVISGIIGLTEPLVSLNFRDIGQGLWTLWQKIDKAQNYETGQKSYLIKRS